MVIVRLAEEEITLSWEEWEQRVRAGRIPSDAQVNFPPVTGTKFVAASHLESYRSLRDDEAVAWRSQLLSGPPPILTALLVGFQIRVWWFARLDPVASALQLNFTNWTAPTLEDAEIWRPLTMGFLHTSTEHLFANMLWLAYTGWNLEVALGRRNLITLYLASVLGGSVLSLYGSAQTPSLGASGGIFGLIAAAMVFGFLRPEMLPERGRRYFGWAMLPYVLLMGASGLMNEGTDNWSHFGGLVVGGSLALVLYPEPLQPSAGWNAKWRMATLGIGATILALFAGIGPRMYLLQDPEIAKRLALERVRREHPLPPFEPVEGRSLLYKVPAGWAPPIGWMPPYMHGSQQSAFSSPSPVGGRYWSVQARRNDGPRTPQTIRTEWTERLMGSYPDAAVGPLEQDLIAGRSGYKTIVNLNADGTDVVEWRFTTRGVWELHETWQVETAIASRLAPLRDRLRASVIWNDPTDLVEARAAYEGSPNSERAKAQLAQALAEVGQTDEALTLWQGLVEATPQNDDHWLGLLTLIRWYPGAVATPDPLFDAALSHNAKSKIIVAMADALDSLDRPDDALGLLEIAWAKSPKSKRIRKARRKRGMWHLDVQKATSLPWRVTHDPVTREVRTEEETLALQAIVPTIENAHAAGVTHRQEMAALTNQANNAILGERDIWDAMLMLYHGRPPADRGVEVAGMRENIRNVRFGEPVIGMPPAFQGALTPEVLEALATVDEANPSP